MKKSLIINRLKLSDFVFSLTLVFRTERFIELCEAEKSIWKILWDKYEIRQGKEKRVGKISEKLWLQPKFSFGFFSWFVF